ncbi:CfrBI family restriction endonuclease [Escherichia coli]|nr:CfrBI family restriction endonuclease [Escherichia coli]EHT0706957.1 CfrBI family restriction endonuclease [Escherichia coli]EHY1641133.1 CfrBI family restriction endonuclease [Escherichia coli]EIA8085343.1 CfrBI family restriction endonuclease [Escherichia coli]EIA8270638.1 CfrBI family restriction endonuclease [Escherichia coli]
MNFKDKNCFPNELIALAKISKNDVLDKFGTDVFKKVVYDVLTGKNVREFTEILTRTRLLESNLSFFDFFVDKMKEGITPKQLYLYAKNALSNKSYVKSNQPVLEWMVMMTNKQTQNVLRDEHGDGFDRLALRTQEEILKIKNGYEDKIGEISIGGQKVSLEDFCYIILSLGSQTLTIRGSEKSLHGKYFEKLILGSLFTIMGFEYKEKIEEGLNAKCFTLSTRADDRESDATLVFNGKAIRVDIGFIGRGNTEISLDKVSRFRRMDDIGGVMHNISTMVIVDVIGDRSRIVNMAEEIDGKVVAMSDPYWVAKVSSYISSKLNVDDLLEDKPQLKYIQSFISDALENVELEKYIKL